MNVRKVQKKLARELDKLKRDEVDRSKQIKLINKTLGELTKPK